MADKINVNPAILDQAAGDCTTIAAQLERTLAELRGYLNQLEWLGSARTAYDGAQTKWNSGAEDIRMLLISVGGAITTTRQNFGNTDGSIARAFGG